MAKSLFSSLVISICNDKDAAVSGCWSWGCVLAIVLLVTGVVLMVLLFVSFVVLLLLMLLNSYFLFLLFYFCLFVISLIVLPNKLSPFCSTHLYTFLIDNVP